MVRTVKIALALVIALSLLSFAAPPLAPTHADATQTYIVLYKQQAVSANAALAIAKAGGTLVYSYDQIGVVIARSANPSFSANLKKDFRIEGVASTANFGTRLDYEIEAADSVSNASSWGDPLSYLQWDMVQIHVPEAHAINSGSPSVVVGDIDTGLDFTHPDLAPNYDAANSVDCTSGAPAPLLPGNDVNGHGTHTAGTIAGISGVRLGYVNLDHVPLQVR